MTEDQSTARSTSSVTPHRLYAEFEITPSESIDCPLDELNGEITDINQQFVGNDCHTDTTVTNSPATVDGSETTDTDVPATTDTPEQGVVHSKQQFGSMCHCPVFLEHDCIPQTTAFNDDHLIVETYLPDRERLSELIDALKDVTAGVSLRRLSRIDDIEGEQSTTVTLELYDLTPKQREAATKAVAAGYYQTPRETTIGELADELDISKSAMSQRLNAVESKLALAAFR